MAQKMLFGAMQKKGSRKSDSKLVKQATPKKAEPVTYVTGNKFKDVVIQAKSMSHRILGHLLDKLELVIDEERLEQYVNKILENEVYAIDTETSGLLPYKDICAGICLYTPGEKGIYVPVNHLSQLTHQRVKRQLDPKFVAKQLQRLVDKNISWIGHNCKFEMNVCYWQLHVRLNAPTWDTLTASILLNENESHSLKTQHIKYVVGNEDAQTAKFNSLFQGIQFPLIPTDVAYMYAAYDPIMTYELYEFQLPYLTEDNQTCIDFGLESVAKYFHEIEMPLIEVLFDMEIYGVNLDIDFMEELRERFTKELDDAEREFKELISEYQEDFEDLRSYDFGAYRKLELDEKGNVTVSITSSTQLAILFYDILGYTSSDKKKPRGTGADILASFNTPISEVILRYRKFAKLVSTYLNMDEFQARNDGRVHTNYNANGARTGRMSSDKPNLQNIPARSEEGKLIRQMFTASDGYFIVGSDYSQQEPRSLSYLANDQSMIDAYKQGRDLYAAIGYTLYKLPYEDCLEFYPDGSPNKEGGKRRNNVKSVLLGQHIGSFPLNVAKRCA